MSEFGERPSQNPLDFIRMRMAAYCLIQGVAMEPSGAEPTDHITLADDFDVSRDIPNTFDHLLKAFESYEKGITNIEEGLWRGAINWLYLDNVKIHDPRIKEIAQIFGCRKEVMKPGITSFGERVETYPFAEGFSLWLYEVNDAELAHDGPGELTGTMLTLLMPAQ